MMQALHARPRLNQFLSTICALTFVGVLANCAGSPTQPSASHRDPAEASAQSLLPADTPATNSATGPIDAAPSGAVSEVVALQATSEFGVHPAYFAFDLYKGEAWKGGSRNEEIKGFLKDANAVTAIQEHVRQSRKVLIADRGFHQKQHGCLVGEMQVLNERPLDPARRTYKGLFAERAEPYLVLVRFSNGSAHPQADAMPDLRGAGLKIFGVKDDQTGEIKTIDLPMTNIPNPPGHDQSDFVEFMKAIDEPFTLALRTQGYFITHPLVADRIRSHTFRILTGITDETFWSGHPYLLGSSDAMKLNLRPTLIETAAPDTISGRVAAWAHRRGVKFRDAIEALAPNYLGQELKERAATHDIHMTLAVQLEVDSKSTPIEDDLFEWKEAASPSIPVAEITFPRQHVGHAGLEKICHDARFTVGHYVSEHRPLSNMGRGRVFAYAASQNGRHASLEEIKEGDLRNILQEIRISPAQ